jgi:hypothetical protein
LVAVQDADDEPPEPLSEPVVQSAMLPMAKATVPVGVPDAELTVAEYVTDFP